NAVYPGTMGGGTPQMSGQRAIHRIEQEGKYRNSQKYPLLIGPCQRQQGQTRNKSESSRDIQPAPATIRNRFGITCPLAFPVIHTDFPSTPIPSCDPAHNYGSA